MSTETKQRVVLAGLAVLVGASGGCRGEGADGPWAGSITDSAGITVVANPEEGLWSPEEVPRAIQELAIGAAEGAEELQFGRIGGLDVDDDGTIYVLDQQAQEVRVFDSAGTHLRTFGRRGSGPGELSPGAAGVFLGPGDTVLVSDVMLQRVTRFHRTGAEAGSFPLRIEDGVPIRYVHAPGNRIAYQARRYVAPGSTEPTDPGPDVLVVRDASGASTDTLAELPAGESFQFGGGGPRLRFFAAEPVWTLTESGRLVAGRSTEYRLEVRSPDGRLERVITRPYTPQAVTEADRRVVLEGVREMLRAQGVPPQVAGPMLDAATFGESYPAYGAILAGPEESLWLQRNRTAAELTEAGSDGFDLMDLGSPVWDVFDRQGRYLGAVAFPEGFTPMRVRGERFYGMLRDELDVQYVARVRLEGGQGWGGEEAG